MELIQLPLHIPLTMLPLPTRFSQVFLDTLSLQSCPQPARFASLLHIHPLSLTIRIPETINAALYPGRVSASLRDKKHR
jgi:hypothetical protein